MKYSDVIPGSIINATNRKHHSNRYYKRLPLRVHLVSLLYGVFSYCNGLRACKGCSIRDRIKRRPAVLYQMRIISAAIRFLKRFITDYSGQYHSFISDSRLKGLSIRNLKIISFIIKQ
ncbi:DUF4372 domain-containing protein [Hydrotalea sp.]|uniref:DUF4372 domain-containing protein n=1 Tax=Hydrotalea sp. TaxID=2881279 RepID=UPI00345C1AE4